MKTVNYERGIITFKFVSLTASFLSLLILLGCSKPDDSNANINKVAYYNFKDSDIEKLLPFIENQQISFKNQFGEERIFKITKVTKVYRNSYTVGMGFFTSYAAKYFDFDEKEISFCNELSGEFKIVFIKWPTNTELAKSNINTEYPSSLNGNIQYFPYWNGLSTQNSSSSYIKINYTLDKTAITINGTIYNDVLKFVSNNNSSLATSNQNIPKNVNIIYYDIKKGIIGFDDLDNKYWRLQ